MSNKIEKLFSPNVPLPGLPIVISGPSGVGKGTVLRQLMAEMPRTSLSISMTTRTIREGERDGEHYHFTSREDFERAIRESELIEWAEFCGNYYGTPKAALDRMLSEGTNVILEIEVQGGRAVREKLPQGLFVFVLPPSWAELRQRLEKRGSETPETLQRRLDTARTELQYIDAYDYVVVNDDIESCARTLARIIDASHHRRQRLQACIDREGWDTILGGGDTS